MDDKVRAERDSIIRSVERELNTIGARRGQEQAERMVSFVVRDGGSLVDARRWSMEAAMLRDCHPTLAELSAKRDAGVAA